MEWWLIKGISNSALGKRSSFALVLPRNENRRRCYGATNESFVTIKNHNFFAWLCAWARLRFSCVSLNYSYIQPASQPASFLELQRHFDKQN